MQTHYATYEWKTQIILTAPMTLKLPSTVEKCGYWLVWVLEDVTVKTRKSKSSSVYLVK